MMSEMDNEAKVKGSSSGGCLALRKDSAALQVGLLVPEERDGVFLCGAVPHSRLAW